MYHAKSGVDELDQHDTIFFFNDTATTEIYTLSLHDALPISSVVDEKEKFSSRTTLLRTSTWPTPSGPVRPDELLKMPQSRSEEHTSELQSRQHLVCRLLLEKKKTTAYPSFASLFFLILQS